MNANNKNNNNNGNDNNDIQSQAASIAHAARANGSIPLGLTPVPESPVQLIYRWLFDPDFKGGYQPQIDRTIALLIVLSVFAVVLETIPEIHAPNAGLFHAFDLLTIGIFTVEIGRAHV